MTSDGEILSYKGRLAGDLARLFDLWWTPQFRDGLVAGLDAGLGTTDTRVVWELAVRGHLRPGALAALLDVGAPAATKSVARLRARQLVSVEADPEDGRAQLVRLTDKGRKIAHRLIEVGDDMITQITADWPADDVRLFTAHVARFRADAVRFAQALPTGEDRSRRL